MLRQSTFAALLWLLAIALLPVRLAHAHLHMCLDGQDTPVAVHLDDVPTHHGSAADEHNADGHNDVDVDVSASATAKKAGASEDAALDLLAVYCLAVVLPQQRPASLPTADLVSDLTGSFALRPPSRGPPR